MNTMSNPNNQRPSYPVTVIKTERVSPHIQRITLQGSNIAHFEKESEGGYIKLLFTPQ
ncbi:siderophore-interacting protein, partial [Vibrio cincinnatiensis]|uniref:siderophore-interacting protein n=1 Tax=Vibrio cincinnatiensis TaxID=675 RepID=UPI0038A004E1